MKLLTSTAPHIRTKDTNRSMMFDVIIALSFLYFMAVYYYGWRVLMICAVAVLTALLAETACVLISHRRPNFRDLSPIVTGMVVAILFPATISYGIVAVTVLFAIVVAKHPFGGTGQNLFNPAAAGFAFASICWPQQVFSYPMPMDRIAVFGEVTTKLVESPAHVLKLGGIPDIDSVELLLGNFPGPMGATNILILATCLLFLIFRKTVNWRLPVVFLVTAAVFAFLFPRADVSRTSSLVFEMLSGTLMFSAVFMWNDPVTSPKRGMGKAVYGCIAAVVTMLFRYYGGFEQGVAFAVLIMNAFTVAIDHGSERVFRWLRGLDFDFFPKKRNTQNRG